jgi:hypothetical protein
MLWGGRVGKAGGVPGGNGVIDPIGVSVGSGACAAYAPLKHNASNTTSALAPILAAVIFLNIRFFL